MNKELLTFFSWTVSKLGRKATLGDAIKLHTKQRNDTRIGNNFTIADIHPKQIIDLANAHGKDKAIRSILN